MWVSLSNNLIDSQGCLGFIDGTIKSSPHVALSDSSDQIVPNPDFLAWKQTDRFIKGWIISTIIEAILSLVIGLDYAADVRDAWKGKFGTPFFSPKGNRSAIL